MYVSPLNFPPLNFLFSQSAFICVDLPRHFPNSRCKFEAMRHYALFCAILGVPYVAKVGKLRSTTAGGATEWVKRPR
jgi:hypothetical protein